MLTTRTSVTPGRQPCQTTMSSPSPRVVRCYPIAQGCKTALATFRQRLATWPMLSGGHSVMGARGSRRPGTRGAAASEEAVTAPALCQHVQRQAVTARRRS